MYPTRVDLVPVEPGPGGVLIRFTAPATPVRGFVIYRSAVPIPPERTEDFYAGAFAAQVKRVRLGSDARALLDAAVGESCWYLVQAVSEAGDLVEVTFEVEPVTSPRPLPEGTRQIPGDGTGPSVYEEVPELVFRADDPAAAVAIRTLAAGLEDR